MSDKASIPLNEEIRKLVYDDLAEAHIQAIENGQITKPQRVEISKSVLAGVGAARTYGELVGFLAGLGGQWPVYRAVYEKYQRALLRD